MKKIAIFSILITVVVVFLLFIFTSPVLAQNVDELAFGGIQNEVGNTIGLADEDPRILVARIINIFLGFLGIIAVVLIMYAGWLWMVSEGNEEKVSSAKKILQNAFIGLIIILISFGAVTFVFNKFFGGSKSEFNISSGVNDFISGGGLSSLGGGIIESHYPGRNQKNVPRNTKIVITFKEEIDPSTIIEEAGNINTDNILIYKTVDGIDGPFIIDLFAETSDNKTFVFKQNSSYVGSPSEYIWYSVLLTSSIKKFDGTDAFPGGNYDWSFEVGNTVDLTPPKITSIVPAPSATEPRNVIIQINFNEAIDPISASGKTDDSFNNIEVRNTTGGDVVVGGIFYISNQYRTVEFLTEEACGTNSCGKIVYCLPGNANLSSLVKAADLISLSGGIVDMAGNSLDGNGDGVAQGPVEDNYEWSFTTSNTIDTSAPTIEAISPDIQEASVGLNVVPEATFNKLLMSSSINSNTITIVPSEGTINYWVNKVNINGKTTVKINHDTFLEDVDYSPQLKSGIMDIYQNCYSACSGLGVEGALSCCDGLPTPGSACK